METWMTIQGSKTYALLDDEGQVVRWFDYQATGSIEVVEPKYVVDWNNYEECLF